MKYKTCPFCGSHLDFGERCDCRETDYRKASGERDKERHERSYSNYEDRKHGVERICRRGA